MSTLDTIRYDCIVIMINYLVKDSNNIIITTIETDDLKLYLLTTRKRVFLPHKDRYLHIIILFCTYASPIFDNPHNVRRDNYFLHSWYFITYMTFK